MSQLSTKLSGMKEIANYLGLLGLDNSKRLRNWRAKGLPMRKVASHWEADQKELDNWMRFQFYGGF